MIKKVSIFPSTNLPQRLNQACQALCMAREEKKYCDILKSTRGIMFMGTPHDGADSADLALTIARIANTVITMNDGILETLKRESPQLREVSL